MPYFLCSFIPTYFLLRYNGLEFGTSIKADFFLSHNYAFLSSILLIKNSAFAYIISNFIALFNILVVLESSSSFAFGMKMKRGLLGEFFSY